MWKSPFTVPFNNILILFCENEKRICIKKEKTLCPALLRQSTHPYIFPYMQASPAKTTVYSTDSCPNIEMLHLFSPCHNTVRSSLQSPHAYRHSIFRMSVLHSLSALLFPNKNFLHSIRFIVCQTFSVSFFSPSTTTSCIKKFSQN